MKPPAVVLTAPGTNRQHDAAFALERAGAAPFCVDLLDLPERRAEVEQARLVVIAGGFSYGDALGSGRVFALETERLLGDLLARKISQGTPVLGVCNGFQMLVRAGLLPGALQHNERGHFECRWVVLQPSSARCVWTRGLTEPVRCPVAHGEGRYACPPAALEELRARDRIAFRYESDRYPANPNGSVDAIAGVCDSTGLVLGMMPHPENHVTPRQGRAIAGEAGSALPLFRNGVAAVRS
jgi:phosphoribosylformylglycinamidine synthase subunit PurQ / glutaminase